ncbi:MAG: hypothetical protein JWQ89_2250 [Devosia sp.]|uniref:hypothetical protein n=1 Tax=Devosia sp. TaxID=1871048 RepID=UPI00261E7412|nr:hypothetical protein [Devosia sp.]MDB5540523.1 hypothetical protein [Devosia sp.]
MAGSAQIGSLRVSLGLDSAQFQVGLKQSQGALSKFGIQLTLGVETIGRALGRMARAFPDAIKGAIDHADELGKASQKIGMSVEALSRLEYAAKLSDVELEGLTTGLRKFSQVVVQAAGNSQSGPAQVFAALGISIKDAAGNLRANDAIFADVADKLSRLEDGALKTSIAMQLFGKSGAELIPLLNSGRAGLNEAAAAADRLGITISTKTAKAAERFNDTLTVIGAILQGVTNKVMEGALPALQNLADFLASPAFQQAAQQFGASIVSAFTEVINWIGQVETRWKQFMAFVATQGRPQVLPLGSGNVEDRSTPGWLDRNRAAGSVLNSTFDALGGATTFGSTGAMWKALKPPDLSSLTSGAGAAKTAVVDLMAGLDEAKPKVEDFASSIGETLADSFSSMADAVMSGVDPLKALASELMDIGKQLLNSSIANFFSGLFGGTLFAPAPKLGVDYGLGLFANGGITDRPAIFGDAGPEAAVPLPDGRSIPVTLSGDALRGGGGGQSEVLIRLDQGLVAQILKQAESNAVQVVKTQAPAAVAAAQRNRGMSG